MKAFSINICAETNVLTSLYILSWWIINVQYIPRNMHTVFALLCFVVVIHWLIFPYPSGLLHCHFGNLTIAPVPAKQPWWIWINTSCEIIMNDCITTTKQSTTKPCACFLGYTVYTSRVGKQSLTRKYNDTTNWTCQNVRIHVTIHNICHLGNIHITLWLVGASKI